MHLIFPEDEEELALTLDGRKKRLTKQNFIQAMASSGLGDKVIEKIFHKFMVVAPKWYDFIASSFLPSELKEKYKEEIGANLNKMTGVSHTVPLSQGWDRRDRWDDS